VTTKIAIVAAAVAAALSFASSISAAPPLKVRTAIDPTWPSFGDVISARVDVVVDRGKVDPRSIRIDAPFGRWKQEGDARTSASSVGTRVLRSWHFTLSCFELVCLPGSTPIAVHLPAGKVTARSVRGPMVTARVVWPGLSVTTRVPPSVADATPFEQDITLPTPTYRVNPTWLAFGLDALAALLAVLGIGLVAAELARRRARRRAVDVGSPLERALAYVREAKLRRSEDRRRAMGLLARTLGRDSDGLDVVASQVAWSAVDPSPERLEEVSRRVTAGVEESK
jgi:hypothetical protein